MSDKKTNPAINDNSEDKQSHGWELLKKKPGVTIKEVVKVQEK